MSKGETMILGLTGGIATGKSTLSQWFLSEGIPVIDADQIAHSLTEPGKPVLAEIAACFGEEYIHQGQLDRAKLGRLVFSHPDEKQKLDALMQPKIRAEIKAQIANQTEELVVLDMPLLYEFQYEELVDKVLVVTVPYSIQLERLMKRNHLSTQEANDRIHSQMPLVEKVEKADFVVDNAGSLQETYQQVEKIVNQLRSK